MRLADLQGTRPSSRPQGRSIWPGRSGHGGSTLLSHQRKVGSHPTWEEGREEGGRERGGEGGRGGREGGEGRKVGGKNGGGKEGDESARGC